jgi:succinyl-CoA synthetase beta subunit
VRNPGASAEIKLNPEEAGKIAEDLDQLPVVIKAQIHAGGRGKGGGVKLAESMREVKKTAGDIIGMNLITHQTGPEGKIVKKVLVEQGLDIAKELYLSIIPDRATAKIVIMASEAGGMDIEWILKKWLPRLRKRSSRFTLIRLWASSRTIPDRLLLGCRCPLRP